MRLTLRAIAILFCFASHVPAQESTPDQADWPSRSVPLFDGLSLAGWEGNAYWFRIESEGQEVPAIVAGRLDEKIPHNEFLCTTQNYDNFELRYEVKLVGQGKNAGVQFRSKRVPGSTEVSGYQADAGWVRNRPVWGALYDESRRKRMLAEGEAEAVTKLVRVGQWNSLRVVCRDNHIEVFLNGEKTIDYTEHDAAIAKYGVIGLQIHSGPPSEAWYRNVRIAQFRDSPASRDDQ